MTSPLPSGPPRVVCISQARMTSSRLPGKVLRQVAGRPLLAHHLDRLGRARRIDAVVVATTVNAADDPVVALAGSLGVPVFRGDENDVLDRFVRCAEAFDADVVVRVTADCPLIDPALIDAAVARFLDGRDQVPAVEYLSIDTSRFPRGFDAEVFSRAALNAAGREATDPVEREHVTPFIYRRGDRFRLGEPLTPGQPVPPYRLCVDEPADLDLIGRVLEALLPGGNGFGWQECCKLLSHRPELADINRGVAQRHVV